MGSNVKRAGGGDLGKAEDKLHNLNEMLRSELAQAAVDAAGIVDPTPISDVVGAGMSLARGDLVGAGLSLISIIPYAGDAIGKTAKGARAAKRMNDLHRRISAAMSKVTKLRAARMQAAALERARRMKAAAAEFAKRETCPTCKISRQWDNRFGTKSPKEGWSGERANSMWPAKGDTPERRKLLEATGGKGIEFKDGYPDFSPYATQRVQIDMKGNYTSDFTQANQAANLGNTPKGYTWHHHQDGVTMELVPTDIHRAVTPHTGGHSIVKDSNF